MTRGRIGAMARAQRILLTGFEPFGGDAVNPSWLVAQSLHGERVGRAQVVAACLPVVFGTSLQRLQALLAEHRPRVVLALGLAASRTELSIERVALNVDDARMTDNAGAQPIDVPVVEGGPAARFATLPIKSIVAALLQVGVPAAVSQTAGTYVCNHVFYGLMHALRRRRGVAAGFIHLPPLAQADGAGGLPLEVMVLGVRMAIELALRGGADLVASGGAES
jgi:pyroglutamyl-peptidase